MNPVIAQLILQILNFGLEAWRTHAGKDKAWKPTAQDWDDLEAAVLSMSAEDYKARARAAKPS